MQAFDSPEPNPAVSDQALVKHLARLKATNADASGAVIQVEAELAVQEVNCCCIWARPSQPVLSLIKILQQQLATLIGSGLHVMPVGDIHLSVIELSHRHTVPQLRAVTDQIEISRIQKMLDLTSNLSPRPGLICPQLSFDKMGVALNFIPSSADAYTYHHLRSDMHEIALESDVSIDMCYTAPSAHITLGRFVRNEFFETREARQKFLTLVEKLNGELQANQDVWRVGEGQGLELQLGYLKFGRGKHKADALGKF